MESGEIRDWTSYSAIIRIETGRIGVHDFRTPFPRRFEDFSSTFSRFIYIHIFSPLSSKKIGHTILRKIVLFFFFNRVLVATDATRVAASSTI